MVDWSGADKVSRGGKNSIWWSLYSWSEGRLVLELISNPRTRAEASRQVRGTLASLSQEKRSVLAGFDFPYGYPAGTAARIRPAASPAPAWRSTWDTLAAEIQDGEDNRSNRFQVAARLNGLITGGASPFWGWNRYKGAPPRTLSPRKPPSLPPGLQEFRVADRMIRGPKSAFQLWGAGSVGSQALLGIPRLRTLILDPDLAGHSLVWPFMTGPALPPRQEGQPRIVHAEIYPSLLAVTPPDGQCKDEAQVRALGRYFAQMDAVGTLRSLFEAPALQPRAVLEEEGWILGVV